MIIDFHTHTFPDKISVQVLDKLSSVSCLQYNTEGNVDSLIESKNKAGIDFCVTLPVLTNVSQVDKVNDLIISTHEELFEKGIIAFGGMNPNYENIKQKLHELKSAGIRGIKIHPAYQNMDFNNKLMMKVIDLACNEDLYVLTHAGFDIAMTGHNFCDTRMVLEVIDTIHPDKLILAHMGGSGDWINVEKDLLGAPVYIDTAFSIGPITNKPGKMNPFGREHNLTDEALCRMIRKHGIEKVLFASDSPWENQSEYLRRIRSSGLDDAELEAVLGGNAARLLGLKVA